MGRQYLPGQRLHRDGRLRPLRVILARPSLALLPSPVVGLQFVHVVLAVMRASLLSLLVMAVAAVRFPDGPVRQDYLCTDVAIGGNEHAVIAPVPAVAQYSLAAPA